MTLPSSGAISLNEIHIEVGGTSASQVSLNDTDVRALISSTSGTQIDFDDFYGASSAVTLTSAGTVNGQNQRQEITVSNFISSGGTLIIPSSIWVWSDDTATAALTIDIPCTIQNEGKIIGCGGTGGDYGAWPFSGTGLAGGPAIKINSSISGVTITNASGAYIAGGGGGGGGAGGGGAGGGLGGRAHTSTGFASGGALNAVGSPTSAFSSIYYSGSYPKGRGGGAGGGGGAYDNSGSDKGENGGGGGGRILPGTGGYGAGQPYIGVTWANGYSGYGTNQGGSAGNAGGSDTSNSSGSGNYAGGGGWGANGGNFYLSGYGYGGAGGSAIDDSGNTYTLTNNGTIYGAT